MRAVRIFLPEDLLSLPPSSCSPTSTLPLPLLGWAVHHDASHSDELIVVVAGFTQVDAPGEGLTDTLQRVPALQKLGWVRRASSEGHGAASSRLEGNPSNGKGKARAQEGTHSTIAVDFFLELELRGSSKRPRPWKTYRACQEVKIVGLRLCIQIFTYHPPRPESLQYFSLHPVAPPPPNAPDLHLTSASSAFSSHGLSASHDVPPAVQIRLQTALEQSVAADPVRRDEVGSWRGAGRGPGAGFRLAVDLINEASASIRAQQARHRPRGDVESSSAGPLSSLLKAAGSLSVQVLLVAQRVLNARVALPRTRKHRIGLVDICATAQQLNTRFGQLLIWPVLSRKLRKLRLQGALPTRSISPSYMSVWNGVWLVANDLIFGRAAGIVLRANKRVIAAWLADALQRHSVRDVVRLLDWLGNWPAGLKLNTELARFFGDFYSGTTQLWSDFVLAGPGSAEHGYGQGHGLGLGTPETLAVLVDLIGICGQLGGLTLILALCADVLALYTLHIHLAYLISRALYAWFLYALDVLFQVFRGKKRNALRGGRVDDAEYELDQRLLGTIFFTLLVFLFPTVGVYYLPFALAEWGRVGMRAGVLEVGLALLNHLPLFGLMLRLKDPARVPAGLALEPITRATKMASVTDAMPRFSLARSAPNQDEGENEDTSEDLDAECEVYRVRSVPASVGRIFHGYAVHFGSARQMPGLLLNVLTGTHIEVRSEGLP
ncbi:pig-Q [Tilletia horrida]|nr:pig-Q [Tilletia horrida]